MIEAYRFGNSEICICMKDRELIHEKKYDTYRITNRTQNSSCISINVVEKNDTLTLPDTEADFSNHSIQFWKDSHDRVYLRRGVPYCTILKQPDGNYSLEYLESCAWDFRKETDFFNHIPLESLLLDQNKLILHSSHISVGGNSIVFYAPSGTGKSTQAELWKKYRNALIVNGDRTLLTVEEDSVTAFGLPFCGSSEYWDYAKTKVQAFVYLKQGRENTVRRLKSKEAIMTLFSESTCNNWNPVAVDQVLDFWMKAIQFVPVYELSCTPDQKAVDALASAMEEI